MTVIRLMRRLFHRHRYHVLWNHEAEQAPVLICACGKEAV